MIKKKRIFVSIHYLRIGGAERSLIGLLNSIDTHRFDVDLFVYQHCGEFMSLIPNSINLLPENKKYASLEQPIKTVILKGYFDIAIARLVAKVQANRYIKRNKLKDRSSVFQFIARMTTPLLPSLKHLGEYDLAISFHIPHNILRDKVAAKKKIGWIHTDYSQIDININHEFKVWGSLNGIIAISVETKTSFLSKFPQFSDRIHIVENILSPTIIYEQANLEEISEDMNPGSESVKLLSIGRYSYAKNFENIPFICRELISEGLSVTWYIIGYGADEGLIRGNIVKTGMEESVFLLGKKSNPYPYIKACDIYIQPSRYEGKAVTVREAQILNKPVVITNYPTAKGQISSGVDGVIVPLDNINAAKGIALFIRDIEKQHAIIRNLESSDFGNEQEVESLYKLI